MSTQKVDTRKPNTQQTRKYKKYTFGSQSLHFSILTSFLQIGGGELPDETTLFFCSRGSNRFAKI